MGKNARPAAYPLARLWQGQAPNPILKPRKYCEATSPVFNPVVLVSGARDAGGRPGIK